MPFRPLLPAILVALIGALLLAGCGGSDGKDLKDVRSCLKQAGFKVEGLQKADRKRMDDAAIGSYESKDGKLASAMAGLAKSDKAVDEFERETAHGEDAMKKVLGKDGRFESGTDGRYVWAYGGTKRADQLADGKDCVQP